MYSPPRSAQNTHTGRNNNTRHSAKINIFSLPPNNQNIFFPFAPKTMTRSKCKCICLVKVHTYNIYYIVHNDQQYYTRAKSFRWQ